MSFLLDTNVVSQLVTSKPNSNVLRWLSEVDEGGLFISAITVRELWYGLERARLSGRVLEGPLRARTEVVLRSYKDKTVGIDGRVARVWASMLARSNKHVDDTGLAATAAVHGLVVVTRNLAHLHGRGVPLLDPFRFPPTIVQPAT